MILIVPWLAAIAVLVFEHLAEGEKQRSTGSACRRPSRNG